MRSAALTVYALLVFPVLALTAAQADDALALRAPKFEATLERGNLTALKFAGHDLVTGMKAPDMTGLMTLTKPGWVREGTGDAGPWTGAKPATRTYQNLADLAGAQLVEQYALEGGELIITQKGTSPQAGVTGVQWGVASIPLTYNILVPGNGGICIKRGSPGAQWQFDYPISWESQMVVVEGPGYGLGVWAEDAVGRYKTLKVSKDAGGFRLTFLTQTNAPFAPQTECASVRWHVMPYSGDWRVPARRYREWAAKALSPTPRERQTPAWAKDIRFVALVGQETPVLEGLAKRVDPKQTLLYVPGWRKFDYDRMYPNYEANADFPAFLEKAHALGFKVMVHCNYFGCDPKSPEYATYEKYQVRNPNSHEREWWLWERADPIIKFAYINPACKAWRDLQVARWKEVVAKYHVDALHLDQTLCIYNDDNGLMDGLTMIEGNIAIQKELHEALPQVAISGEGLDEVTMRYEAFAQRHAFGLDFVGRTWDRRTLEMAHPISSYLVNPYTQPYGYLGFTSPADGQFYAAWRENYRMWGVLPTIAWPTAGQLEKPEGFVKQVLDEGAFFTQHRLNPDFDGEWPAEVCFPYKGEDGTRAAFRLADGGTTFGSAQREVSRIITGVSQIALPGSLPGWKCYDDKRMFGLNRTKWYAYSPEPRDMKAFHVSRLPDDFTVSRVTATEQMATVEVNDNAASIMLADRFDTAKCGSQPFGGEATEMIGAMPGADNGAMFTPASENIFAHPPWRATVKNPQTGVLEANGTGIAYAAFPLDLPDIQGSIRFACTVAMDQGAVGEGKTDGVLYTVIAAAAEEPEVKTKAEVYNATADRKPLTLDLGALRGKKITLRLEVDPGPNKQATFDWARWYSPRVEIERHEQASIGLANMPFTNALASGGAATFTGTAAEGSFAMEFPGTLILLKDPPQPVTLPLDLAKIPFLTTFISAATGELLYQPQYAAATTGENTVGGVTRAGLFTHPPNEGLTEVAYPIVLPAEPAKLHCFVGLRDGSKSEGCGFIVKVNGQKVAYVHKVPGEWSELTADLAPWAGKPVVLALALDSVGPFNFDWGCWGEVNVNAER